MTIYSVQLPPRYGADIKAAELRQNMVYIETANGDVWRLWIERDADKQVPVVELVRWGNGNHADE